jgi:O-antigen/teichoic acid export membrane protein
VSEAPAATARRGVAGDTAWNIVGQVVPALVALVAIPLLLRGLGEERFGVLGLTWALVGYLSLFDLGLGRAVTRFAAEALGAGDLPRFRTVVWTGWLVLAVAGVVLALLAFAGSGALAGRVLNFSSPAMAAEGRRAFMVLALAIPAVVLTAGIRGVLEASGHFREANLIRIPLGALSFVAPVLLLPFTRDVAWHVAAVAASRALGVVAYGIACLRLHPVLRGASGGVSRPALREMLAFGSWITVSSVVSPFMVTMDRFIVGAMLSVAAVSVYVTPFELASRVLILPAAFSAVLFPRFAAARARADAAAPNGASDSHPTGDSYGESVRLMALMLAPIVVIGVLLTDIGLRLWVGGTMATEAAPVLKWLLVGVLFNGIAHVPFAWLQGHGRADLTAKAHLIEAPLHLALLWVLVRQFGVTGAAVAWAARAALDLVLLHAMQRRVAARPFAQGAIA